MRWIIQICQSWISRSQIQYLVAKVIIVAVKNFRLGSRPNAFGANMLLKDYRRWMVQFDSLITFQPTVIAVSYVRTKVRGQNTAKAASTDSVTANVSIEYSLIADGHLLRLKGILLNVSVTFSKLFILLQGINCKSCSFYGKSKNKLVGRNRPSGTVYKGNIIY